MGITFVDKNEEKMIDVTMVKFGDDITVDYEVQYFNVANLDVNEKYNAFIVDDVDEIERDAEDADFNDERISTYVKRAIKCPYCGWFNFKYGSGFYGSYECAMCSTDKNPRWFNAFGQEVIPPEEQIKCFDF